MISKFLKGRAKSFEHAFAGVTAAFESEVNLKIHLFFTFLAIICGFLFDIPVSSWLAVIIVIGMVWCAELFNTAIETAVDFTSKDINPLAKKAKDVSAAAVLITAITSIVVGLIVFIPEFLSLFLNL